MIKEALEYFMKQTTSPVTVEGKRIFLRHGNDLVSDGTVSPKAVHTRSLTGYVDLVTQFMEESEEFRENPSMFFVSVDLEDGGNINELSSSLRGLPTTSENLQHLQKTFLSATPLVGAFPFNRFLDQEDFIINFIANFDLDTGAKKLLKAVQQATVTDSRTEEDDGISQTVTTKKGLENDQVKITNPVTLNFRGTFPELPSVETQFIFRQRMEGGKPLFQLTIIKAERAWIKAAQDLKDYLLDKLPDNIEVI